VFLTRIHKQKFLIHLFAHFNSQTSEVWNLHLQASTIILCNIAKQKKLKSDDATKAAAASCSSFNFAQDSTQQDTTENFQHLTHFCTRTSPFYPNDIIFGFCFSLSYSYLGFLISRLSLNFIFCCQFHVVFYCPSMLCLQALACIVKH